MAYTKEEWEWLKAHLIEGCTYIHTSNTKSKATIQKNGYVKFDNPSWVLNWDVQMWGFAYLNSMFDFKWPDGSPMIPFVEHDGKPYNPVLAKIKSLEVRFGNKSLPKTTQKALALP